MEQSAEFEYSASCEWKTQENETEFCWVRVSSDFVTIFNYLGVNLESVQERLKI